MEKMKTLHAIKLTRKQCSTVAQVTDDGGVTWKSPFAKCGDDVRYGELILPLCGDENICSRSLIHNDYTKAEARVAASIQSSCVKSAVDKFINSGTITGRIHCTRPNVKEIPRLIPRLASIPSLASLMAVTPPEPVRNKVGFTGFCVDSNHGFDEGCKDPDDGCLCWKECYDTFADEETEV